MQKNRKLFKRADIVVILILLALAAASYAVYSSLYSGSGFICEISYDGNVVKTVDLSLDRTFSPDSNSLVVFEIKNNSIAFIESDCPDKVCVNSGYLAFNGQMTACLPNKLSIRVLSKGTILPDEPDLIAH